MPLVESPYSTMHKLAKNESLSDIGVNLILSQGIQDRRPVTKTLLYPL